MRQVSRLLIGYILVTGNSSVYRGEKAYGQGDFGRYCMFGYQIVRLDVGLRKIFLLTAMKVDAILAHLISQNLLSLAFQKPVVYPSTHIHVSRILLVNPQNLLPGF